ncbi:MAG TPA: hypothetical protein VKK79_18370 [Candidatus Lokiarchaeia archaeon]|nr:hypothetical protein [Candidatus Lokiarchaeia archaeon]
MVEILAPNREHAKQSPFVLLVWFMILATAFNATYAACRWIATAQYFAIDPLFLGIFRNVVVVFMALSIFAGIWASRRDSPKQKNNQHPRAWVAFEVVIITMTAVDAALSALKGNALYPVIDFSAAQQFIQNMDWLNRLIGGLVNLNIILLAVYIALKIPIATGTATSYFNRVYIFGRRVHESIIGLAWIVIAAVIIMYGDMFDRWLGIFYLQFGMFLVGRDYLDVNKLAFLKDLRKNKGRECEEDEENPSVEEHATNEDQEQD